jgi:hypothetical protein
MLTLNLKLTQWTAPELPNWAFWGICLGLGLLITGIKGLGTAFGLGREIKKKDKQISELTALNTDLQARLDVFLHDPYIKKGLSDTKEPETDLPAPPEPTQSDDPDPAPSTPKE